MMKQPVSKLITSAFVNARIRYQTEATAWRDISWLLSGRFSLSIAVTVLQRQGDIDLLLRAMEDEFDANRKIENIELSPFHYQFLLSEYWVSGCYEILRTFRQRDREKRLDDDSVSSLASFESVFADLELLRVPMMKFEIPKDRDMRGPLAMTPIRSDDGSASSVGSGTNYVYDKNDPTRVHIIPTGISARGSLVWLAISHDPLKQYWVERRDLADRLLAIRNGLVPAGILEASKKRPNSS